MPPSNDEIVSLLNELHQAREEFDVQKRELMSIGERRGDPTLKSDISHFLEAFDRYHSLVFHTIDAVHGRINEELPPAFLGIA